MNSPYEILGIGAEADEEAIKKAYRELSKKYHPDIGGDKDKFIEITNAYETLTDPVKRRAYEDLGVMPGTPEFEIISEAVAYIGAAFSQMIQSVDIQSFKHQPLIDIMITVAKGEHDRQQRVLKGVELSQKRISEALEIITKQCKRKKDTSPNIFKITLLSKMREIEAAVQQAKHHVAVIEKALEMLADYEFNIEKTPFLQSPFCNFSSVTGLSSF